MIHYAETRFQSGDTTDSFAVNPYSKGLLSIPHGTSQSMLRGCFLPTTVCIASRTVSSTCPNNATAPLRASRRIGIQTHRASGITGAGWKTVAIDVRGLFKRRIAGRRALEGGVTVSADRCHPPHGDCWQRARNRRVTLACNAPLSAQLSMWWSCLPHAFGHWIGCPGMPYGVSV